MASYCGFDLHFPPVLLLGKSHGWRSLVGYSPWGLEESDTTERLHFHFSLYALEKEMATHSSVLAWRTPGTGAWWAAIYGVTQSWTWLMWLSSSSSSSSSPKWTNSCIINKVCSLFTKGWSGRKGSEEMLGDWVLLIFFWKRIIILKLRQKRNVSLSSGNQTAFIIYYSRFLLRTSALN